MRQPIIAVDDTFDVVGVYCPPPGDRKVIGQQVKVTGVTWDGIVDLWLSQGPDKPFQWAGGVPYERVRLLIKDGVWVSVKPTAQSKEQA